MMQIVMIFISIFSQFNTKKTSNVVRLEKVQKSPFDEFCERICPYLILSFIIILMVFLFITLLKYGHFFSTEANGYYYHLTG